MKISGIPVLRFAVVGSEHDDVGVRVCVYGFIIHVMCCIRLVSFFQQRLPADAVVQRLVSIAHYSFNIGRICMLL